MKELLTHLVDRKRYAARVASYAKNNCQTEHLPAKFTHLQYHRWIPSAGDPKEI